ncbi:ABC transporter ATP-binding protein [Pasteurellaceae bacterium RH1A]|nr:ABC transporter ATP-binding protein [Pasteurellaceae bacterium RH1A]
MKQFLKRLYSLIKPFWGNKANWLSWLIFAVVIGIGSGIAYINVRINEWQKGFYDALAKIGDIDINLIYSLLTEYFIYIAIFVVINVYRTWLRKLLIIRWRESMTEQFIGQWLANNIFYKLAQRKQMDNPDQRIAEDIRLFVEYSIELTISLIFNLIQLYSFLMILWNLSGQPEFTFFGHTFVVKGYLVWVALIYSIFGTIITHLIGNKLHHLNYRQQVFEANFRTSLIHKQDNAEQIALYKGQETEKASLANEFKQIVGNWRLLMNRERNLGFFTVWYDRFSLILPVLFSIPLLIAKIATFGGLMQIRSAFGVVLNTFSWFIFAYSILPKWSAAISRLSQLKAEMEALEKELKAEVELTENIVDTQKLTVFTPENKRLLADISLSLAPNKWVRLKGQSGLGKSTFLRVLSGIWDFYQGSYRLPKKQGLLIPQRPYLNDGSLAELLSYPNCNTYSEAELNACLEKVKLNQWVNRLDEVHNWQHIFSGGEQQRIAFARILLNKPEVIYLDEVTSNLDKDSALALMQLLKEELPQASVVYISHQEELAALADEEIDLGSYRPV